MITIKHKELSVEIDVVGAQVSSVQYKSKQYLWDKSPPFWGKSSPLLFPVVGRLLNNSVLIGGKNYKIQPHGFLQHLTFEIVDQKENEVSLQAFFNQSTLAIYPFKFSVLVNYSVFGNLFKQSYLIKNLDDVSLSYGFGLHPAVLWKQSQDDVFKDFYIEFNRPTTIYNSKISQDNMLSLDKKSFVLSNDKTLYFNEKMFLNKTIITLDIPFNKVSLFHKEKGKILTYEFDGFDIFAMWKQQNSPFVCLEPWTTLNGIDPFPKNLEDNPTVKTLKPSGKKRYTACFSFY